MNVRPAFADSNILIYLASSDVRKVQIADGLLQLGLTISVQVLNEIASVLVRKYRWQWHEVEELLALVRRFAEVRALDVETHEDGIAIARRYQLHIYDSMIVAAALRARCETLYSEDMQDGLLVEGRLRIVNPFAA